MPQYKKINAARTTCCRQLPTRLLIIYKKYNLLNKIFSLQETFTKKFTLSVNDEAECERIKKMHMEEVNMLTKVTGCYLWVSDFGRQP